MKHFTIILIGLLTATMVQAKVHVPDSVMHRDGLYVDNMKVYSDSAIFQGVNLKLDMLNTLLYLGLSKTQFQTYEIALNVRLKQRFYPTVEFGYAQGQLGAGETTWNGKGGWTTVGLDFNGLSKERSSQSALLVGLRIGTAVEQYDLHDVKVYDPYWQDQLHTDFLKKWRTECWGEVVAGCQVNIYSGLMMGWYVRLKLLFTRKVDSTEPYPYYVPGFGYRNNTQWGLNYYIGWKF